MTKICSKCGVEKDVEEFHKDNLNKDGLHSDCKLCRKKYRENNKDKLKQYYIDNKEKIIQYQKQYRENNKDKLKQYQKQHKERILERRKKYYKNVKPNTGRRIV